MTKKEKLKELYDKLNKLEGVSTSDLSATTEALIEEEVAAITSQIKNNPTIKILQKFNLDLQSFRKDFDIKPIMDSVKALQVEIETNLKSQADEFKSKLQEVKNSIPTLPSPFDSSNIVRDIQTLRDQFLAKKDYDPTPLKKELDNFKKQFETFTENDIESDKELKDKIEKEIDALRIEFLNRLANHSGGGNMNRQIFINGTDRLTKYTDMNIKAGTNVTITSAINETTKKVDITIAASGGGGGGGITREIDSISASTPAGSTAATDYVYLCTGTLTLTLPDATTIGSNLYTIKNVGNGVVTVATTSSQTIDGALTQVMPVKFTSIDVESDSANWNIT